VKVVVDASIAAAWLVNDPASAIAAKLLTSGDDLIAPDLIGAEVTNAIWKRVVRGETALTLAEQLVVHFGSIGVAIFASAPLLKVALQLAAALGHPVYDCLYFALAQSERAVLATADQRMAAAAHRLSPALTLWRA
jgi:predicted nucleic acid-binding protein